MSENCGINKLHPCFVAADLGASSGRVIAGQLVDGTLRLHEVKRFPTGFTKDSGSGYLCWAIDDIEEQIREGLKIASELAPVSSIGVDSWAVDYLLLDADRQLVGKAICYRDDRTQGMIEQVTGRLSAAEIYQRTGIQFQFYNTIYQLAAMAEQEP
jgi:rhamnulokinase